MCEQCILCPRLVLGRRYSFCPAFRNELNAAITERSRNFAGSYEIVSLKVQFNGKCQVENAIEIVLELLALSQAQV